MKLTLVGAGPGDPDLITLKGIKALQKAKVVLYDSLTHPALLDYCPDYCVKVLVGKRFGKTSCGQDDINQLIVDYAKQYGEVVRLKGGDSFIFGRGYEEIVYVALHNIESEVIPGISSSYAVPALAGIPLTAGFIGKYVMFANVMENYQIALVIIAILNALVGFYYYFKVIIAVWFKDGHEVELDTPLQYKIVLVLSVIVTLLLGVYPDLILNLI